MGNYKHGMSNKKLYYVWKSMISRCYNSNDKAYKHYGKIGVTVCNEWKNNVKAFCDWGKLNGYDKKLFLDKDILCKELNINPHIYSPKTCQFIDRLTNNQKTRILKESNTSGYRGSSFSSLTNKWLAQITVNYVHTTIGYFNSALEAAKAYDYYILVNNLNHTPNGILKDGEIIDLVQIKSNNTSGYTGVSFDKQKSKWMTNITVNKKHKFLGYFDDKLEAAICREKYIIDNSLKNKRNFKDTNYESNQT